MIVPERRVRVTIDDVGYIRPRRARGYWHNRIVLLDEGWAVRRLRLKYLIVAEFKVGSTLRRTNVVGTAWTKRGARRAVDKLFGGDRHE